MARNNRSGGLQGLLDFARNIAHWLILLGGLGCGISLLYLGYGIAAGHLANYPSLALADRVRIYHSIELATRIFHFSALGVALGLLLRNPGQFGSGYVLVGAGAVLNFGMPLVMRSRIAGITPENPITYVLTYYLAATGLALMTAGLCACLVDAILRFYQVVRSGLDRRADDLLNFGKDIKPGDKSSAPMRRPFYRPSHCWELPTCPGYMRKLCPAFQSRRSCWRRKAGCLCDTGFMLRVMQDAGGSQKNDLKWLAKDLGGDTCNANCRSCRILESHAQEKFAMIAPLTIPVAIVLAYLSVPKVHELYALGLQGLSRAIYQVALAPGLDAQKIANQLTSQLQSQFVEWLLVVTIALWVANILHRLVEYVYLDLKL